MYHAPSKKKQLTQRIVVYSSMSLAVISLVTVLFFFMMGYRFNQVDGRIQQGGLVQFESRPNGAFVEIDGSRFGTRTTAKTTLAAGPHTIMMSRDGYQQWRKSIEVKPGSVLWLNYARLIPLTLKPDNVADLTAISSSAASPNKRFMAIKEEADTPVIKIADLSQADVRMDAITLPESVYTAPAKAEDQRFTIEGWDTASRRLIVRHVYGDNKTEWLVVNPQRVDEAKNLTTLLGVDVAEIAFHPTDSDTVYVRVADEVRRVDISAATLSGPLVKNIEDFSVYRDTILYTTKLDKETQSRTVGYYDNDSRQARTIRTYASSLKGPLHVAVGKYFESTYVALSQGDTVEVMQGSLPRSNSDEVSTLTTVATMTAPKGVKDLSIETNGRFVVAQSASSYIVHDIELNKTTNTALYRESDTQHQLEWIDEYMLWTDQGGILRTYEFDGANQHDIMPVVEGQSVTLSTNGTYLYGISQSEDKTFHLTRVRLILQ